MIMDQDLIKEARQIIATALRKAADMHDARKYDDIDSPYDDVLMETSPLTDGNDRQCNIAFIFWDSWGDASRHDWRYYKGIGKEDWPRFARVIASTLESDNEITDPLILEHFDLAGRPTLLQRLKKFFTKG
jgi:hypothetical protein